MAYRKLFDTEYSKEEVLEYLKHRAELLRHTPKRCEIERDREGPKIKDILKYFPTYNEALIAAELPIPIKWSEVSDQDMLEAARTWSKNHNGAKLSRFVLKFNDDLPSETIITNRFGGIKNYFEAAQVPYDYQETSSRASLA